MVDTATARFGARQQSQGSNVNTWGDDKLNEALRLFDRGSKGVQSLAMTGDTTLSWTNYVATNEGQCAVLLLVGSPSSSVSLIVPSREWVWDVIKNSTGWTVTVKTSAGIGVAIPNGRCMRVYCDGTDCFNGTGSQIPSAASIAGSLAVEGRISGVAAGTTLMDAVNVAQMGAAIANATLPASAGTLLVDINDTTADYASAKLLMHPNSFVSRAVTGSGNEQLTDTVDEGLIALYVGVFV